MATEENIKEKPQDNEGNTSKEKNKDEQPLPFHNPLKPDDDKKITQQDIENEEKFIEAQTERD